MTGMTGSDVEIAGSRQMSKAEQESLALHNDMTLSKALANSDMYATKFGGNPANLLGTIMLSKSLGIDPMVGLTSINVIQGVPTQSALLIAARVRGAGHRIEYREDAKRKSVSCTITRKDDGTSFTDTWDMDRAKANGLTGRGQWSKDPLPMLRWRATTGAARFACPEVVVGIAYSTEEMQDSVTAQVVTDSSPAYAPQADENGSLNAEPVESEQVDATDGNAARNAHMDVVEAKAWVHEAMSRAGVRSAAQAMVVLKQLTGRDGLADTDQLTDEEALSLASDKDWVAKQIAKAVRDMRRQERADATPQAEATDATPQDSEA